MNNYVYSTLVDWLSNLAEVILNAFEEDRSLIIHLNEHQIGNRESAYTLKFIFVPFLVIKYPQMAPKIGQIFKRKPPVWMSAEKAIFYVGFDVLRLQDEFQTEPLMIFHMKW